MNDFVVFIVMFGCLFYIPTSSIFAIKMVRFFLPKNTSKSTKNISKVS